MVQVGDLGGDDGPVIVEELFKRGASVAVLAVMSTERV